MKLDDTVCRGSLIIHKGESYVVLGAAMTGGLGRMWKLIRTPKDGVWKVDADLRIQADCKVDTFFPGAVFEIPDYIR